MDKACHGLSGTQSCNMYLVQLWERRAHHMHYASVRVFHRGLRGVDRLEIKKGFLFVPSYSWMYHMWVVG